MPRKPPPTLQCPVPLSCLKCHPPRSSVSSLAKDVPPSVVSVPSSPPQAELDLLPAHLH